MIYFDRYGLEAFSGATYTDFRDAGIKMTATVWERFVVQLDQSVAGCIHRFCGVPTFGSHQVEEYHSGKGMNGTDDDDYTDADRTFLLLEPPTGNPEVYVDTAAVTEVPSWQTRYMRSAATGGDYAYSLINKVGIIRFNNNVPDKGYNNVRIVYWAGFEEGTDDLEQIRLIAKRLATNLLMYKKKVQESQTIRNTGVRDYSEMFDLEANVKVFTPELEAALTKYKRFIYYGGGFS